jgi:alpha-mannosidase
VILRLVEMEGIDKDIEVRLPFKASSITRCNLVEEVLGPSEPVGGNVLKLHLGHNSIETYVIN